MPPMFPKPVIVSLVPSLVVGALTNLPRGSNSPAMMSAQIHAEPAHNHRHGRVHSHGRHEQSSILQRQVVVYEHENDQAGDRNANRENRVQEAVAGRVARCCHDHGEDESHSPRRDRVQLRLNRTIVVRLEDGGRKVRVAWNIKESERANPKPDGLYKPYAGTIMPKYMKPPSQIL